MDWFNWNEKMRQTVYTGTETEWPLPVTKRRLACCDGEKKSLKKINLPEHQTKTFVHVKTGEWS